MRLLPRLPPNGSLPPTNGMLDRSMSTLIAPSRVAPRTTLTSQVLSECPDRAASSSALVFTDSGMRSVMRATLPSSPTSSAAGGEGGAGGAGGARGGEQVAAQALDVRGDVHVHHCDITMTSCQARSDVKWRQ